jgi:hypothetical protein
MACVDNPMVEGFIQLRTRRHFLVGRDGQNAVNNFNSRAPQNFETFAGMFWIRIGRADDNFFYSGGDNGVRARRRAAVRATRFERDIKRRAARIVCRVFARRGAPRFPRAANPRADASRAR